MHEHSSTSIATRRISPGSWPRLVATSIVLLNAFDALLTLVWVHADVAEEANELWGDMVKQQPLGFLLLKLLVVTAGVWFLHRVRHHRLARVGLVLAFAAYAIVLAWHLTIAAIVHGAPPPPPPGLEFGGLQAV
ncbi:MAG: DUF5658 family protein [Myxococcota bacterium]